MKRFLLLIIAITTFNTAIYAETKIVVYKSNGSTYMAIQGNFEKRILVDGDVSIVMYRIQIEGKYEKGELIGKIIGDKGFIVDVQGTISNNENGGISTKCKPYEWKCDLKTRVIPAFDDRHCEVPATSSLVFETSPITINLPNTQSRFVGYLKEALQQIKLDVDNRASDKSKELYSTTITFSDELIYEGFVKMNNRTAIYIPRMCKGGGDLSEPPLHAKLTWPNGDTFEGSVYNAEQNYGYFHSNQIRPNRGTIKYQDGQVFEYSNRNFADFKIGDNGLCVSPSEMRESFETTIREREEERLRKIREEEERKAAELRAKQEEEAKKIARKNELIRKYGQKYGEAIYNGEPKTGMTIEMVQDMHQKRGHATRRISNGNEITVLSYGGDDVSLFGISGITASYRYTFVNGRLTEFTSTDAQASMDWF